MNFGKTASPRDRTAQVIKKVGPYIENPDFTPKAIEKASVACKAICMWSDAAC